MKSGLVEASIICKVFTTEDVQLSGRRENVFNVRIERAKSDNMVEWTSVEFCDDTSSHADPRVNTVKWHTNRVQVREQDSFILRELREQQLKDSEIVLLLQLPDTYLEGMAVKGYWAQWDSLIVEDGVLKRVWERLDGTKNGNNCIVLASHERQFESRSLEERRKLWRK